MKKPDCTSKMYQHMPSSHLHLLRRGESWFFRMAVPRPLWGCLGKQEIALSLRTTSLAEARIRSRLASNWLEMLFRAMKSKPDLLSPAQIDQLIQDYFQRLRRAESDHAGFPAGYSELERREYLAEMREELHLRHEQALVYRSPESEARQIGQFCETYGMAMPAEGSPLFDQLAAGMRDAWSEVTRMTIAKLSGQDLQAQMPQGRFAGQTVGSTPSPLFPLPEAAPSASAISLTELVEEYVATKKANSEWRGKTLIDQKRNLMTFVTFMRERHSEDEVSVGKVTLDALRDYQALLQRLPPHAGKKYKGLTMVQAAEQARAKNVEPMKPINVAKLLSRVREMLDYAEAAGHIKESPYNRKVIRQKFTRKKEDRYQDFTKEDLVALFGSKRFNRPSDYRKSGDWWVPLLALYTGARRSELVMLEPEHVAVKDGIKCLIIADTEVRRLKNDNSNRIVPIHPHLLEMGFFEYAEAKKRRKSQFLFPDMMGTHDPSDSFGKRFSNMLTLLQIKRKHVVFHSFRHTFITQSRLAGIPKDVCVMITGHEQDDVHDSYGNYTLAVLAENIAKVDYGLEWKRMLPLWKTKQQG